MAFNKSENQAVIGTGLSNIGNPPRADVSYGTLFEGLGQALTGTLSAVDSTLNEKIQIDADKLVNDTLADKPLSPELQAVSADITRMKAARDQGVMDDRELTTSIARQVKHARANYPGGYGADFEAAVQSALGRSTANAQRREDLAAIEDIKNEGDATRKEKNAFLQANQDYIGRPNVNTVYSSNRAGRTIEDDIRDDSLDMNELQIAIGNERANDAQRQQDMAKLALGKAKAEPIAQRISGQIFAETFNEKIGKYSRVLEVRARAEKDGTIDDGEMEEISASVLDLENEVTLKMLKELSHPMYGDLDGAARTAIMKPYVDMVNLLKTGLADPNFGLINRLKRQNEYAVQLGLNALYHKNDEAYQAAISKAAGFSDQFIDSVIVQNGPNRQKITNDISEITIRQVLAPTDGAGIVENMRLAEPDIPEGDRSAYTKSVLKTLQSLLNSPKMEEKDIPGVAVKIFAERNWGLLDSIQERDKQGTNMRLATFRSFVTPRVVSLVEKDPAALKVMHDWSMKQFDALSKTARDTVMDQQENNYDMAFAFDGERFVYSDRSRSTAENTLSLDRSLAFPVGQAVGAWGAYQGDKGAQAADEMNQYIQTMKPVWKAMGIEPKDAMGSLFRVDVQNIDKAPTILQSLSGAVQKYYKGEEGANEVKGSAKADRLEDGEIGSTLDDESASQILGLIGKAEGADYSTIYGGSKLDLENMTVQEVQVMQRKHGKKTGSSATGAYQVMRRTLSGLIDDGVVDPDEKFTPEVQDRIGMALLKVRGYDRWKSGSMSTADFAQNLSKEWASLPSKNGRSYYDGDKMGNKASKKGKELVAMLDSLK